MWKWLRRRLWQLVLGALLGVLIWLVMLPPETHQRLERALGPGFSGLVRGPASVSSWFRGGLGRLSNLWDAEAENARLREELALLKIEYRNLQDTLLRNQKRGTVLRFGKRYFSRLKPVQMLVRDPASWFNQFTLDQGSRAGIRVEDGVLNDRGVVGKIVSVTSVTSRARFLTDLESKIPVRIRRSGVTAVLVGDGAGGCRLDYLAGQDDVRVGDMVETAPAGLSFPVGVPVGRVVVVEKVENGLKLRAEVDAAAELGHLKNLYVVGRR